jgi:ligand-binding sensor domain-containing protein/two-component sensor histidine kinase
MKILLHCTINTFVGPPNSPFRGPGGIIMRKYTLLFGVGLLFTTLYTEAQVPISPSLFFEKVTVQDGLSHDKVNCILQDRKGFIWIGTNDGLNRYDGHNFIIFRNKPGDTTSISGNTITDLLEDEEGLLWIATDDGGLTRYDYRASPPQQFKQYKNMPGDNRSIPVNIVNSLIQDNKGDIWLGTSGASVIRFNKKTAKFDVPMPVGPRVALDLCIDKQGMIWAGRQGGGIIKVNPSDLSYTYDKRYDNLYANLPHMVVTSLFTDRDKNIWYGSWDKVLYSYDQNSNIESVFQQNNKPGSFTTDEVISFAEDKQGNLWIGGKTTGLQVMNKRTKIFFNYRHNPLQEGSLADNTINCIFIDKEGEAWLGTNKGISICKPAQQKFTQVFLLQTPAYSHPVTVFDFFRDENKDLWIGTSEGIFIQKHGSGAIPQHIPLSYQGTKLAVTKFYRDQNGVFYIGTNYSLFVYNKTNGSISLLPNTEKDKVMYKLIESRIVSITEDIINGRHVLIVSPYGHYLAYYDFEDQRWVSRLDSAKNILGNFNILDNLVHKMYKSSSGKIWMANRREGLGEWITNKKGGSIFYKNDPTRTDVISNNHIYDITEDNKGNLWVSTNGGGLNYVEMRGRKISHMTATSNPLEGIATDSRNNVWMISNKNLEKFDVSTRSSRVYLLPDLEKTGGVTGYIYKDNEGRMYVGGNNYFIAFHPDSIEMKRPQPKVFITDFKIFNNSSSQLLTGNTIKLSHRQNYFTFEFAAPDYSSPEPVEYAYMLEGFDPHWIETGSRNTATFSNLSGGTYTFRVKATNNPGTWSDMEQTIKIIITPPFWKRWWFYALCAAFITASIYVLYRYRINEILKRQAIRNKIAQDLHDNVGSTLSSISVYSQVAQIQNNAGESKELNEILDKISITSTDMISEMNDIVWAINPRNDNMEKIVQRMESFAKPLLAAKGIQFRFQYDVAILSTWLQMEKRKNFYLIFKEVINNIIKYSQATTVTVDISIRSRKLDLLVKDNGIGFDTAKAMVDQRQSLSGNGLRNMRMRAAEMKGDITIKSKSGEGTSIHLITYIP